MPHYVILLKMLKYFGKDWVQTFGLASGIFMDTNNNPYGFGITTAADLDEKTDTTTIIASGTILNTSTTNQGRLQSRTYLAAQAANRSIYNIPLWIIFDSIKNMNFENISSFEVTMYTDSALTNYILNNGAGNDGTSLIATACAFNEMTMNFESIKFSPAVEDKLAKKYEKGALIPFTRFIYKELGLLPAITTLTIEDTYASPIASHIFWTRDGVVDSSNRSTQMFVDPLNAGGTASYKSKQVTVGSEVVDSGMTEQNSLNGNWMPSYLDFLKTIQSDNNPYMSSIMDPMKFKDIWFMVSTQLNKPLITPLGTQFQLDKTPKNIRHRVNFSAAPTTGTFLTHEILEVECLLQVTKDTSQILLNPGV